MPMFFTSCFGNKKKKNYNTIDRFNDNYTTEEILSSLGEIQHCLFSCKYETNLNYYVISNMDIKEHSLDITKYKKKIMLKYVIKEDIDETNICAICLENTKKKEEIVTMDLCNHQYHKNCAIETLDVKEECPLCRKNIYDDLLTIQNYKNKNNSCYSCDSSVYSYDED